MSDYQKLIEAHNGDMALYYIWKSETKSDDIHRASRELCLSLTRIEEARELLKEIGISFDCETEPKKTILLPADEEKQYSSQDISSTMRDDASFKSVTEFAEEITGRVLSKDDLNKLLDIYSNLGMPAEVIYVLLTYCKKMSEGPLRMKYVSTVAYDWANLAIDTAEAAEKLADKRIKMKNRTKEIMSILGVDYRLTPSMIKNVNAWIEDGVTDDIVETSYEATVKNTGKLAWTYLDKVIRRKIEESKHKQGEVDNTLPTTVSRG